VTGTPAKPAPFHWSLLAAAAAALAWSGFRPHDRFTWFLEVVPALIGGGVLLLTYKKFPFTRLVYLLMFLHAVVLMVGGKYTYAEMPLFNWLRDAFGLARNYYDRLGHFMQGFVPAMIAREIFVRKSPVKSGGWLFFVTVCFCLAFSASYELFEWAVARATGEAADAFLGTQGDVWDTQWDMFLCVIGALTSLGLLSAAHDRALRREGHGRP
jgi:putative membrane protein